MEYGIPDTNQDTNIKKTIKLNISFINNEVVIKSIQKKNGKRNKNYYNYAKVCPKLMLAGMAEEVKSAVSDRFRREETKWDENV